MKVEETIKKNKEKKNIYYVVEVEEGLKTWETSFKTSQQFASEIEAH